jgi:hypothetical protein
MQRALVEREREKRDRPERAKSLEKVAAERRVGEMMTGQRETVGLATGGDAMKARVQNGPEVRASLSSAGIDKHLADRARKYAAIPEEKFEAILSDRRDRIEQENARVTVNLTTEAMRYAKEQELGEIDAAMGNRCATRVGAFFGPWNPVGAPCSAATPYGYAPGVVIQ